jgi:hypothetical protein
LAIDWIVTSYNYTRNHYIAMGAAVPVAATSPLYVLNAAYECEAWDDAAPSVVAAHGAVLVVAVAAAEREQLKHLSKPPVTSIQQ